MYTLLSILLLLSAVSAFPTTCQTVAQVPAYWASNFLAGGIAQADIDKLCLKYTNSYSSTNHHEWYYDGTATCVPTGEPTGICNSALYTCPLSGLIESAHQSTLRLSEAISNGGVHPECPRISDFPYPNIASLATASATGLINQAVSRVYDGKLGSGSITGSEGGCYASGTGTNRVLTLLLPGSTSPSTISRLPVGINLCMKKSSGSSRSFSV